MILIIEDEPLLIEFLDDTLQGLNHLCLSSYNDLIKLPTQTILDTSTVISDMYLEHNLSAINVKDYVLNINPKIKCHIMSGGDIPQEIACLFQGVLLKPFNLNELLDLCTL
jgi:DNA-binding NtrC family response regulator